MQSTEETSRNRSGIGTVTIHIDDDVHKEVKSMANSRNVEIKTFVNSALRMTVRRYNTLKQLFPNIKFVEFSREKKAVILADLDSGALVSIVGKEGKLFCSHDKKQFCSHIAYMLLLPETALFYEEMKKLLELE